MKEIHPIYEHLEKGIKPFEIIVCPELIYDPYLFVKQFNSEHIDWFINLRDTNECAIFSNLNKKSKSCFGYQSCTGIIAIGKSKKTGENISFLTHQLSPDFSLSKSKEHSQYFIDFVKKLQNKMETFLAETEEMTRDIIMFGGINNDKNNSNVDAFLNFTAEIIFKKSKIVPRIIKPPKADGTTNILLDTQNRKIYFNEYIVNKDDSATTKGFVAEYSPYINVVIRKELISCLN